MKEPKMALYPLSILIFLIFIESQSICAGEMDAGNAIEAQDILEKIERGENVSCQNIYITGYLNIQQLNLSKNSSGRSQIDSPLSFYNCIFLKSVNFNNVIFNNSINFTKCIFEGKVNMRESELKSIALFRRSEFHDAANFDNAAFRKSSDFRDAVFSETASFAGSIFDQSAYFIGSIFENDAHFGYSRFGGIAIFEDAEFRKSALFHDSILDRYINFQNAIFSQTSDFENSTFLGYAQFLNARFDAPTDFSEANFSDQADFGGATFNKVVRFSNVTFKGNVSFSRAFFERDARFETAQFDTYLDLTGATIYELMLPWKSIEGRIGNDKSIYSSLINNYKNIQWIQDRNDCYYEYREIKRNEAKWSKSKFFDTVSWAYWGYGVRPLNAIFWLAAIVLLFAVLYSRLATSGRAKMSRTAPSTEASDEMAPEPSFYQFLRFSTLTLASKDPDGIRLDGSAVRYIIWLERVAGGFFLVMFVKLLSDEILLYFKPPT